MPIFHDHDESAQDGSAMPRTPERWWERQRDDTAEAKPSRSEAFASSFSSPGPLTREQLIERLKRRQSPPWSAQQNHDDRDDTTTSTESSPKLTASQLLPAVELHKRLESASDHSPTNHELGQEIERPRSALHRGDFRPQQQPATLGAPSSEILSTSPVVPWHRDFPHAAAAHYQQREPSRPFRPSSYCNLDEPCSRSRATSHSSLSSFVLMPPTSPLVHASNNPDLDFATQVNPRQPSRSPDGTGRRHTFSPQSFQSFKSSNFERSLASTPAGRHFKREATFPYQAHQPRRSLSNIPNVYSTSIPQTPQLRPRRPSITSDSPIQHAPMVGSYEESILRGRMSTTPSRPLNFVAQIGVLGKGQCKPNLRCPPHVTVPFPAVFYSYNSGSGRLSEDSPSPYVGLIDLENSLPPPEDSEKPRRRQRVQQPASDNEQDGPKEPSDLRKMERRKKEKMKRRSASPKVPPGGSYRIPQQGQLQIIIKNPNKTAVKLFLVPYDLSDMEPGQKTFIRQRSYSAGPIIDMPVTCRKNFGSDRPEAALSTSDDPSDRPVLRYLIHLHICCPSKGRYYLYKSVRVVFANRVPDDKEKLRNEIQLPEPRYSLYKPTRDSAANSSSTSSAAAALVNEKAMRRRSAGIPQMRNILDGADGLGRSPHTPPFAALSRSVGGYIPSTTRPIPFNFPRLDPVESRPASRDQMDVDDVRSPSAPFGFLPLTESPTRPSSRPISPIEGLDGADTEQDYQKWTRGANGYSNSSYGSVAAPPAIGEGLLARRLRGLDVQRSPTLGPQLDRNPHL